MLNLTDAEKGYIAGIIDGEGCLTLRHQNNQRSYYATIQVSNTDFALVAYLMRITGYGRISTLAMSGNRKIAYKWQVTVAAHIYEILDAVKPFLVIKEERAELLYKLRTIKSQGFVRKGHSRGKLILSDEVVASCYVLFEKMRELNWRGLREKEGELLGSPERTISSQAGLGIAQTVQRLEAEARTASNASTSALPERDDIVRAA